MTTGQGVAYKKCLESFGGRHTVMGFFDVDEFLVLLDEKIRDVNTFLKQ
jgi:hypothetical protein